MIYVRWGEFVKNTERYLKLAANGTNVYILMPDSTELKLTKQ